MSLDTVTQEPGTIERQLRVLIDKLTDDGLYVRASTAQEALDMGPRAGFKMRHFCNKHGLLTFKVSAPEALRAVGITEVNAYPLTALCEVL